MGHTAVGHLSNAFVLYLKMSANSERVLCYQGGSLKRPVVKV